MTTDDVACGAKEKSELNVCISTEDVTTGVSNAADDMLDAVLDAPSCELARADGVRDAVSAKEEDTAVDSGNVVAVGKAVLLLDSRTGVVVISEGVADRNHRGQTLPSSGITHGR